MYTCNIAACIQAAQVVQRELSAIGITVDISSMSFDRLWKRLAQPGEPWDIAWQNWQADYADPADFLSALFDHAVAFGQAYGFANEPFWLHAVRQARSLSGARRLPTYGRLDDALASRAAPIVAWSTGAARDFFAPRIGCQTYQPIYGMDLGTLCIRS
jgi:ABC-type oligopeptide transport system substrate-binding subunit